jgi:membrane protease YdiL (CAAX protease family)
MNETKKPLLTRFKQSIDWRLFAILLALVAFGLLALVPYGLTIAGEVLDGDKALELLPQFWVQIALFSVILWIGLVLAPKAGLTLPILSAWAKGERPQAIWQRLSWGAVLGIAAGLAVILLDLLVFAPLLAEEIALMEGMVTRPPVWQGFLASFYGGIVEEVLLRLYFMTLLVWLGMKLTRQKDSAPARWLVWIAIVIAGIFFGIAHLPTAIELGIELTPLFLLRTLALNSIGIVFGWLYWKKGFESAVVSHFCADIMIHVVGALLVIWLT